MGETNVSLKLHIDTEANKVLFAEAGEDFIDFLYHVFSLPFGAVVKLLSTQGMVSLADLSKKIAVLGDTPESHNTRNILKCSLNRYANCRDYVTDGAGTICPECKANMSICMTYVEPKSLTEASSSGGYVEGVPTYMVMDNLEVMPLSSISSITHINSFNIKEVIVGLHEGIEILKASLESQDVLTAVFLGQLKVTDIVCEAISNADLHEEFLTEYQMARENQVREERRDRKKALLTYIDDTRDKLYNKYNEFVSPLEKDEFTARLQQVERWLYEEGGNETKSAYIAQKLQELEKQGDTFEERYTEYTEGEAAIHQLDNLVHTYTDAILSDGHEFDDISNAEKQKVNILSTALKGCMEAETWLRREKMNRKSLPKHATPGLRSADVRKKIEEIDRLCEWIRTRTELASVTPVGESD